MKRVLLLITLFAGVSFIYEANAQENLLWEIQQAELEKEYVAVNKNSRVSSRQVSLEQLLGSQSMQEQVGQEGENSNDSRDQQNDDLPLPREQEENSEEKAEILPDGLVPQPQLNGSEPGLLRPSNPGNQEGIQNKQPEVKQEDSVLEFNFLYFLIQKFKISEVME